MKLLLALLALASAGPSRIAYIENSRTVHPSVVVTNANGGGVHVLGPGGNALLSPDGGSVAAVRTIGRDQASSELLDYPAAGGPARELAHVGGFVDLIAWSPDSQRLLIDGPLGANSGELEEIDVASGAITRIAGGAIYGASFSPSGDQVVYARASSLLVTATANLYVYDASGSRELLSDGQDPVWGATGIVFARSHSRGTEYAPINQLWLVAPDGSGLRQLTQMKVGPLVSGLVPVAVSADGEHVLADFQGTDTSQTWTVDLSGAQAVVRRIGPFESVPDAISRDGSEVLVSLGFEGTPPSLEVLPWAGGPGHVIAAHGYGGSWNAP